MEKITLALMKIVKYYDCVFVGNPNKCIPYALFATTNQAHIFCREIDKPEEWIMSFVDWWNKYGEELVYQYQSGINKGDTRQEGEC